MPGRTRKALITAALLGLCANNLQAQESSETSSPEQGRIPLEELRNFADVYHQIRVGYVEEIDDSTLLEYAIQGMLMNLDPHSTYLKDDAFENLQDNTKGEFTGLGLEVGMAPQRRMLGHPRLGQGLATARK